MKIELTMTELLLLVDMIKNGTEHQDNEGDDFYLMQDFLDADWHHNRTRGNTKKGKTTKGK